MFVTDCAGAPTGTQVLPVTPWPTTDYGYSLSIAGTQTNKYILYCIFNQVGVYRGLKYVSKYRRKRVDAIARFLADSDYDIVTLQELWVFADYEHVREAVSKKLPYSKFFYR